jgi:Ran GTPase-activating protein (RanGAP) involved in mRNA processing and transport
VPASSVLANPALQPTLSTENNTRKYSTMHADFFNAWDQQELTRLVDICINAGPFPSQESKPQECF